MQAHRWHILALAARADCEQALGAHVLRRLEVGEVPSLLELEHRFAPPPEPTAVEALLAQGGCQHPLALYDALLPAHTAEAH